MIGCLRTRFRKQPIIALYFESETAIKVSRGAKFYNLEAWLLYFNCLSDALLLLVFCDTSSQCHGFLCSVELWYFLIILTYFFEERDWMRDFAENLVVFF